MAKVLAKVHVHMSKLHCRYLYLVFTSSTRTSRGRKFPPFKKNKPIRTLGPIEKNHPPALSLTCLLLWSRQRMCSIAMTLTSSRCASGTNSHLWCWAMWSSTSRSVIAMCKRTHWPTKCMDPAKTAHILPSIWVVCLLIHLYDISNPNHRFNSPKDTELRRWWATVVNV